MEIGADYFPEVFLGLRGTKIITYDFPDFPEYDKTTFCQKFTIYRQLRKGLKKWPFSSTFQSPKKIQEQFQEFKNQ